VTGFLVGFSQNYTMLIIFLVLMGILGGGYHPAAATLISSTVETKTLGRAMGFHMTGGGFSYFLVPLIAAGIAAIWGWRGSFIALSVPTLIFGIIFYIFLRRQSSTKKAKSEAADSYQETTITRKRLSRPIIIIILSTLLQAILIAVGSLLPLYMVDHFNASKETAAASVSLIYSAGLWVGPLGGYLSDRTGRVLILLTTCLFAGPVIYSLNLAPYGWGIGIVLVIIGILIYANATVAQAYIVDQTSERNRSTILGIFFFGTMEGSGILTPLIGYFFDKFGFYSSFAIVGATLLASTIISLVLLRIWRD
jgi:FSR family fosmidomycin resistance protein-like MFS transporter